MADETIIDGVDVSGCSAYKEGKCLITKDKCNARCDYAAYYLFNELQRKEQECEKWKSYYALYRQNEKMLKKIQGVINSHPKYGVELTKTGIIDKDERISSLNTDEQIKLIFTEYEAELQTEKDKVEELENLKDKTYFKLKEEYNNQLTLYKQALKEIKGIVKHKLLQRMPIQAECIAEDAAEILQKCEVLEDE